jgi:hypothetical protein
VHYNFVNKVDMVRSGRIGGAHRGVHGLAVGVRAMGPLDGKLTEWWTKGCYGWGSGFVLWSLGFTV